MPNNSDPIDLDFPVKAWRAGEKWEGSFLDLLEKPTLVSVYMRNNTGSCDKQVAQLKEVSKLLKNRGLDLIGLSKDTVGSHFRYAAKHGLDFTLVSDPDHCFAKATSSLVEKKMYGKVFWGPTRSAYLIDKSGVLLQRIEQVEAANHAVQIQELLERFEKS